MELTSLSDDRTRGIVRDIVVDAGNGQSLAARVRPAGQSTRTQRAMLQVAQATDDDGNFKDLAVADLAMKTLPVALAQTVVSWDVTVDGEPLEPTADALSDLGLDYLMRLWALVQEGIRDVPFETAKSSTPSTSTRATRRKH